MTSHARCAALGPLRGSSTTGAALPEQPSVVGSTRPVAAHAARPSQKCAGAVAHVATQI